MSTILLIEDDAHMAEGLRYNLERSGYKVFHALDGNTGLAMAERERPDLVLLDLMLPGLDGFDLLQRLRRCGQEMPVIILSAKDGEGDKIRGFDRGADDYVSKPFGVGELLARIRVRLGRSPVASGDRLKLGVGTLQLDSLEFVRGDERIALTPTEVDILRMLIERIGKPVPREDMLRELWGLHSKTSRTLDTHVTRLRKKIEANPAHPCHLQTVHGVGYRLNA